MNYQTQLVTKMKTVTIAHVATQITACRIEAETIGIVGVALWEMVTLIQLLAELVLAKDNLEIAWEEYRKFYVGDGPFCKIFYDRDGPFRKKIILQKGPSPT